MAPKGSEWHEQALQRAESKQTHVSFPQLKYPSVRDGNQDPTEWLRGKSMDDGAEGLWRVHDKLYDMEDFIPRHPGGANWLELTKGTDITEAFESHHLNPSVPKLLEKYYTRPAKSPRNSPFTFNDDGFYRTLKVKIYEKLKTLDKSEAKRADNITDALFACMFLAGVFACWFSNTLLVAACVTISGLCMAWSTVCSHNYIHRKNNWRMYIMNFTLKTYRDFRISHILSHHLYPNTLMDLEISAFEPIMPWNPRKKGIYAKLAVFVELLLFPNLFWLGLADRMKCILTEPNYIENKFHWDDYLGLMFPAVMWLFGGKDLLEVLFLWFCIICVASFVFHAIGLNAAHHHPDIFHDGDQSKSLTPDWGMHELEAVMDRTDITGSLFRVMTFFGDHALHHLFPTLDHALLHHLYPIFLEHCEKHKANFRMTSSLDLLIGQVKQLVRTEMKAVDEEVRKEC